MVSLPGTHIHFAWGGKKTHFISVPSLRLGRVLNELFLIKQLAAHTTQLLMTRFVVLSHSVWRLTVPKCDSVFQHILVLTLLKLILNRS